jgi:phage tail-like protein
VASGTKYFTFNRKDDWKYKSFSAGTRMRGDNLLFLSNSYCSAFFLSALDSLEEKTIWHRLRIKSKLPESAKLMVRLFAGDKRTATIKTGGRKITTKIDDFLMGKTDAHIKIEALENMGALILENPQDAPLFSLKGRFLWVCIEAVNYSAEGNASISEMKIEFPQTSFASYLPEVYHHTESDSFFMRFISIFQNMYLETEEIIDFIPSCLEPLRANEECLKWIADWFLIKHVSIWEKDKVRTLIGEAVEIFRIKGTKRSVAVMVEKYTGAEPIIIEKFNVKKSRHYSKNKQTLDMLFGENDFVFSVILSDKFIKDEKHYANMLYLIETVSPIDTICNLVAFSENIFLDHHCYLGVNSRISNGIFGILYDKNDSDRAFVIK